MSSEVLHRMIGQVRHRGPDEAGFHCQGRIGLAHARLSIIDLASGQQPMSNEDRTLWVTFNGEIFNYLELRKELEERGHRFATRSDTEVILHLYEERGEDCVRYFNGQWAFAIWDARKEVLFLARDRMGVRPLFYTVAGGCFLFGSELKCLLAHPAVTREVDLVALDQIFTFWSALPPRTFLKGIQEIPPGHSLTVEAEEVRVRRYWQLDYRPDAEPLSEEEYAERLLELLVDATRIRLRSDVPVGAYLSGGLDSTVVTSIIRRFTDTPLKTFSVTFEDPEFDESAYQREVIDFLNTDHHEIRCASRDIGGVFPEVIWHAEKPILRTAPAPLFLLSSLVREMGYKVVLTGEGSDEVLGGYDIFKEAKIRRFWGRQPASRMRPLLLRKLYPYLKNIQSQSEAYLKAFFHVTPEDLSNPLFSHLPRWAVTSKLKVFFSEGVKASLRGVDPHGELVKGLPPEYSRWDGFSQAQFLEAAHLLPGYILSSQGDRVAMAHSVEGRFPFLDHRVVEFAGRIPPRLKMRALNEKYILKLAAGSLIPPGVRKRAKQPYRAPDARSFFAEGRATHDYVEELLSPKIIEEAGLFNPLAVEKLVEKAKKDQAIGIKDNMAVVGILSSQLAMEQLVKNFGKRTQNGDIRSRDPVIHRGQLPVRSGRE